MLCEFQKGDAESWNLLCTNVTQRFGFSLLDTVIQKDGLKQVQINLTSSECVYSPQMAIVRLQAPEVMRPDAMRIEFRAGESGNPAVVPPDTRPAVYIDRRLNQPVSLPEAQVTDTSLLLAELTFMMGTRHQTTNGLQKGSPQPCSILRARSSRPSCRESTLFGYPARSRRETNLCTEGNEAGCSRELSNISSPLDQRK